MSGLMLLLKVFRAATVHTQASLVQVIGAEPLGTNNMADAAACKAAGALHLIPATISTMALSLCLFQKQC